MTGLKVLPALPFALAATLLAAPSGWAQDQAVRLSIVVDKSCLIQPESDAPVLDDHNDPFRNDAICHLESVLSSHHIEEKITEGERSRFFVRVTEQEYVLQNPTSLPSSSSATTFQRIGRWTPSRNHPARMAQRQYFA